MIKIVYGPPCSGKSTFVKENMTEKDICYDYDRVVSAITNKQEHTAQKTIAHKYATAFRFSLIKKWEEETEAEDLYIITRKPTEYLYKTLGNQEYEEIGMDTTLEECLNRLENDTTRPDKEAWKTVIEEWFSTTKSYGGDGMKISKAARLTTAAQVTEDDLKLINQYALKVLTPEEVYTCSVFLCDNDIDRDGERFTESCLDGLAPLFLGKTGIFNHSWDSKDQVARIYRTEVVNGTGKAATGSQLKQLKADIYMLRAEDTEKVIQKIEGGILKEVSVGVAVKSQTCSICGGKMQWGECENGHEKGREYEGKTCHTELSDPADAFEFSFVAVPAQRKAGVAKSYGDFLAEFKSFMKSWDGLEITTAEAETITGEIKSLAQSAEEKQKRREILAENKKFMEVHNGNSI